MKRVLQGLAFVAVMATATSAYAATAMVTTNLNLRTGPSTAYPAITSMPDGVVVNVRGCTAGYNWCRVDWNGYDGWAAANYLAMREGQYRNRYYSNYGAEIGIPLIAGAVIGGALLSDHHHHWRRHHGWHGGPPPRWRGGPPHHWRGGPPPRRHGGWHGGPPPRFGGRGGRCPGGAPPHHGTC